MLSLASLASSHTRVSVQTSVCFEVDLCSHTTGLHTTMQRNASFALRRRRSSGTHFERHLSSIKCMPSQARTWIGMQRFFFWQNTILSQETWPARDCLWGVDWYMNLQELCKLVLKTILNQGSTADKADCRIELNIKPRMIMKNTSQMSDRLWWRKLFTWSTGTRGQIKSRHAQKRYIVLSLP